MAATTRLHADEAVQVQDTWVFDGMNTSDWDRLSVDNATLLMEIDGFFASLEDPGGPSEPGDESRTTGNQSDHRKSESGALIKAHRSDNQRQTKLRKHRESMSRLRRGRRETIQRLEVYEQTLHHQLHQALALKAPSRSLTMEISARADAYREAVVEAEILLQHNNALDEELSRRQRYAKLVTGEIQRLQPPHGFSVAEPMATRAEQVLDDDELLFACEPETQRACTRINAEGLRLLDLTRHTLADPLQPVQALHCLGWESQRLLVGHDRPVMHFRFTRHVPRMRTTLKHLEDTMWAMLHSPTQLARLYGSTVECKYVHCVSQDAFILLRNSPVRENHKRFRYYNLNTRIRAVDGQSTTIAMLIMNKKPRYASATGVTWLGHGGASLRFSHVGDDSIEIEYVGTIQCQNQLHATHLMIESCASLMRWEQIAVPSRLLL